MTRIEKAEYDRVRRAEKKDLIAAQKRANYLANKERDDARIKAWGEANKERLLAIKKKYRDANKNKIQAKRPRQVLSPERKAKAVVRAAAWRVANPEKYAELCYLRKRRVQQAKPAWVDNSELRDVYTEARHFQMDVDHIIPLVSKTVCGLHVPWNLQLLYHDENKVKGNRYAC